MWCDIDPIWLVKQVLQLYMAAVIDIISRHGLSIDAWNQPNKSKGNTIEDIIFAFTVI